MLGNFRGLINSLDLREIPLIGRRFTWSNQREEPTLLKLDHVFCTTSWVDSFPDCSLHSNATTFSDHCPLTHKVREVCLGK
jgi:exonuclease III